MKNTLGPDQFAPEAVHNSGVFEYRIDTKTVGDLEVGNCSIWTVRESGLHKIHYELGRQTDKQIHPLVLKFGEIDTSEEFYNFGVDPKTGEVISLSPIFYSENSLDYNKIYGRLVLFYSEIWGEIVQKDKDKLDRIVPIIRQALLLLIRFQSNV